MVPHSMRTLTLRGEGHRSNEAKTCWVCSNLGTTCFTIREEGQEKADVKRGGAHDMVWSRAMPVHWRRGRQDCNGEEGQKINGFCSV